MSSHYSPRYESACVVEFIDPRVELLACDFRILPQFRWKHERLNRPYWRLYWNASSGAVISCGGGKTPLNPSHYLLIAPNTSVSTFNDNDVPHFFVHFKALAGHIDSSPRILSVPATPLLNELREQTLHHLFQRPLPTLRLSLCLRSLVETCIASAAFGEPANTCRNARILKAISYIEENLGHSLTNEDLAQRTGLSVSAFNRQFKREMGHAFHDYLQIRRIERACHLLQRADYPIEQIAEEVGFCDRFYFSRVFKVRQGITPGAYRLLHQE